MIRLSVLFHRLGPYHIARLHTTAEFFKLAAIEYAGVDSIYNWDVIPEVEGFKRITLFPRDNFEHYHRNQFQVVIADALSKTQPEVVAIPGWGDRCSRAALLWCKQNKVPIVIMSDSLAQGVKRPWWKEAVKKQILRFVSAGLTAGAQHRSYLESLGLPGSRIFLGFDAVNNDCLAQEAQKVRNNAAEFRRKHQLPEHYFLASARFIPKKNIEGLIEAYGCYRQRAKSPWKLVLLGDGPLKSSLIRKISDLGLQDSIFLPGFKQYHELPVYYALANAFINPSFSETWGLTVNEAMACGLPVIVSSCCGCASDLVVPNANGYLFDPKDGEALPGLMARISEMPAEKLQLMGQESSKIIGDWGTDRFASSMESAAQTALRVGPRGGTLAGLCLLNLLIGL